MSCGRTTLPKIDSPAVAKELLRIVTGLFLETRGFYISVPLEGFQHLRPLLVEQAFVEPVEPVPLPPPPLPLPLSAHSPAALTDFNSRIEKERVRQASLSRKRIPRTTNTRTYLKSGRPVRLRLRRTRHIFHHLMLAMDQLHSHHQGQQLNQCRVQRTR